MHTLHTQVHIIKHKHSNNSQNLHIPASEETTISKGGDCLFTCIRQNYVAIFVTFGNISINDRCNIIKFCFAKFHHL